MILLPLVAAALAVEGSPNLERLRAQAAQMEQRYERIRSPDPATRLTAAREVAALPGDQLDVLLARLLRARPTSPDLYRMLFLEMWAQVPNPSGAEPMWIRKLDPLWIPPP